MVRAHCRAGLFFVPSRGNKMVLHNKNKPPVSSGQSGASGQNLTAMIVNQKTVESPRFLVVKRLDGSDFSKVSPFLISKAVYGIAGETKQLKKSRDGLLIETSSSAQSKTLLKINRLADFQVEVVPHALLNFSKGVVYCRDFLNCSITEIEENLKDKGVIAVKRIQVKKDGILVDTPTLILTFDTPKVPKYIIAAMYRLEVRPFIPNPLRCFRCQRFGHTSTRCTMEEICVCGKDKHEGSPCDTPSCVNCGGEHFAQYRECPKYKEEVAIQKVKATENISYREAKKKVVIKTPTPNVTYSQRVQTPSKDNLQDIVKQITPEIVRICTSIITSQRPPLFPPPTWKMSSESLSSITQPQICTRSTTGPTQDKRPMEESEDSDIQSSSSQIQAPAKRRPGRPSKKNKESQSQRMESEGDPKDRPDIVEIT